MKVYFGGELGTRTLNALRHNGFQDRPTTNYHNSPLLVVQERIELSSHPYQGCVLAVILQDRFGHPDGV